MKNKKGFVLTETLIVTVFLVTIFTFIYTSVIPLIGVYRGNAERMENIDIVYKLLSVRNMIKKDNNRLNITEDDVKKLSCYDLADVDYCVNLLKILQITDYELYFTKSIKNNYADLISISDEFKNYLKPYQNDDFPTLILYDKSNYSATGHSIVHLRIHNNLFTLYDTVKEASVSRITTLYTGEHNDNLDETGDKEIYYYNGSVSNKNHVIFAGYCWQIIRTTDTGGVKLLYNGLENNGKCSGSGNIGMSSFNYYNDSLADVGFKYNVRYVSEEQKFNPTIKEMVYSTDFGTNLNNYYSQTVSYDGNNYSLNNPSKVTNIDEIDGQYTFLRNSETYTNRTVYYILGHDSSHIYYLAFNNGNTTDNVKYIGGSKITLNTDTNMYTIGSTKNVTATDWYNSSLGNIKYFCLDSLQTTSCAKPILMAGYRRYPGSSKSIGFSYYNMIDYKTSSTFDYSAGTYTLNGDISNIQYWVDTTSQNKTSRYSCLSSSSSCNSIIKYIYYSDTTNAYYISLNNGKTIDTAINEMLFDENVNNSNSTIKNALENWYRNGLLAYEDYIEDSIYCNNRTIDNYSGWLAGGNANSNNLTFKTGTSLYCENELDRFAVSNAKARLAHPIGLMTYQEANMIGTSIRQNGTNYWLMSPASFKGNNSMANAYVYYVNQSGAINSGLTDTSSYALRPVIVLKAGISYSIGDGSRDNPYLIYTPYVRELAPY